MRPRVPRHGVSLYSELVTNGHVAVCDGYGLIVREDKGHLTIIENGETRRYTRAGDDRLSRLVIIAKSGMMTLDAMQWCGHLSIPVICIGPDGKVLWTTAYASDNGRVLRAQALSGETRVAINIARDLLRIKLELTSDNCPVDVARILRTISRVDLAGARTIEQLKSIEGVAAKAYFDTWDVAVKIRGTVPQHWTRFDGRRSVISGRNRAATDPVNAMLNYLYTIASTECRLACHALALSPLLGVLHNDAQNSEPLVLDLLETVRPIVDRWVKELCRRHEFKDSDFRENVKGICRIDSTALLKTLTATGTLWARAVAPHAEMVLHEIAKTSPLKINLSTPLTSGNNRLSRGHREYVIIDHEEWEASFPA